MENAALMTSQSLVLLLAMSAIPWPIAWALPKISTCTQHEANIIAYNVVVVANNLFMAVVGTQAWLYDDQVMALRGSGTEGDALALAAGRLYTPLESASVMLNMALAYEVWNTICSLVFPEYRTASFLAHHLVTYYLAVLALHPFLHYYVVYFLGMPSISSTFLGLYDVFKHVPSMQRLYPRAHSLVQLGFASSFLVTRSLIWPVVAFYFWRDVIVVYNAGRVHSLWACGFYLTANLFLSGLQLVWTGRVVDNIKKALWPAGADNRAETKAAKKDLASPAMRGAAAKKRSPSPAPLKEAPLKDRVTRRRPLPDYLR